MWDQFRQRFEELLRPLFPEHADIRHVPSEYELEFLVDWKLRNDTARPNKRSAQIAIRFCQDLLEDYEPSTSAQRARMDMKIYALLAERVPSFQPNYEFPYHLPAPNETWAIATCDVHR